MTKKYFINIFIDKDELDWNKVPKEDINVSSWKGYEKYDSTFQICYIKNDSFIIKLTSYESSPWANANVDMGSVYLDSCLEAFISFDKKKYINLETNSLGTRLQAIGENRYNRIPLINNNENGFDVRIDKSPKEWSVIIELPIEKICKLFPDVLATEFESGFSFLANFYKTGLDPVTNKEHYMSWIKIDSPLPDFHLIKYFGILEIK